MQVVLDTSCTHSSFVAWHTVAQPEGWRACELCLPVAGMKHVPLGGASGQSGAAVVERTTSALSVLLLLLLLLLLLAVGTRVLVLQES